MSNAGWKKYGGVHQMNNLNNVSVYSIASDILTLRQGYYGAFDVCGELHVSQIARFDERVFAKDLTVIDDICANRLLVEGATVHHANVSIYGNLLVDQGNVQFTKNMDIRGTARVANVFYVGDSGTAFLYGTPTIGNIGVNQSVPMAGWDMSSAVPFAFHVKAPRSDTVSGAFETGNGHAVGIRATSSTAQIEFSVETPFSQTSSTADARIQYASGGILTIDVSDNTNVRSRMAVNPRFTNETNTPSHLWKETVSVYDDAAVNGVQYLPDVYDNENARTANALTLVAADNTDNTFLHWSTPDKRGLAIGGGAYASGARSMGAFGLTDSCGQFVPSMNLVSGNSHTHYKSCWGVNTHAPKVDDYVVDINGPLHINNGELTVLKTTEFEVVGFQNGKTNTGFVVAVGSPRTSQAPFKQQILYTKDEGKTWTQYLLDFTGTVLETNGVLLKDVCVVDSSFALVVGEQGLVLYSFPDESVWPGITLPFEIQFDDILSVYVRPETNRAFFGLTGAIFWADLGTQVYTDANGFGIVSSFTQGTLSLTGTGLRSVRGFEETLWAIQGTKILKFINIDTPTPTQQWFYSRTSQIVYTTLHVLDNHHVCALAGNTITFSHNASSSTVLGAQWTNVGVDGPFAVLNSVCLLDASNAVVVGNNGLIYFSNDGYHSWNPIPYSQLNTSGNADRLLDERYNLTNISCEDNINFFITQTTKNFNATTRNSGETRVFQIYLPNLFESKSNYVMDISGCVHLSGDLKINDGGSIISEESVFHVLDTQVDTVYVGGETTNITMGSTEGNVYLRGGLDVQGATTFAGNVRIQRQLSVGGNTSLEGNLAVLSAVTVAGHTFLQQDMTVAGNTTLQGNSVVNGILFAAGDYAVVEQDLFVNRDATITGETDLSGNAWVRGNLIVESVLDVSDVVIARNDVVAMSDISLNQNMFVGEAIYSNFYDGLAGTVFSTPDIYIGGKNILGYSSRNIRIGNFNTTVDTSNVIYLGGRKDQVIIEGSIQQSSNLEAGPVIYLNATALPSSSAGAGIHIGDDGNKDAGYIVISNDLKGFILQPTNPNNFNALKLNVMDTTLPTNFTTGLLALNRAPDTVLDADYEITTSVLDPSNLLLKNKLLATTAGHQVVDSSFSVTGRMSVGTTSTDSNAALVVNGNLQQLSGQQWQFTSSWPAQPGTSNRWKQSYVQGFVDISGGPLILRNSDASFNGNLSLQQNFVYSGVVVQKTATVSSVVFGVTTPVFNTYNIATNTNTVITLPNIDANNLRGAIINFVKTANAGILVTFQSDGNANGFVANGGTASAASFAFLPAKTSMAFLAGETGNWIEVGFSIGTDLSVAGNISAGTNLTVVNGNLTVSSGRTNLRDTTITGNVTVTQNTTLSGTDVTIAGNVTTQGNTRVYGGFYPYQPAVAAAPTATGIFIGDSGRFRQAISTNNVSIGPRALEGNTTVNGLATNTGVNNVAIGSMALNTLSSGSLQTAVGVSAGEKSQFGTQNVFLGASAGSLGFRTSASTNNVVVGFAAGSTADVEYANVSLLGASTLDNHTATSVTGTSAVGAYAGQGASVLNYSTLVGTLAGQNMAAEYATSVGYLAGQASTSSWSTAVGAQAGKNAGLYSTFLGSRSATVGGSFTNVTAVGYGANAVADYEFVVGGDDGNSSGLLPLLTLPNKMKIGGVQVISSSTTLSFRSEENVVVTTGGINLTLPTPNATRTALNVGARFHVQKTFTGTLNVVAPAGQTILYLGSSFSTLVSPSTEYHMTLLCVGTTGNTWLALNVQGVDLKSAQTIQGIKTFSSTPVFSAGATSNGTLSVNGTITFVDTTGTNVTATGNLITQGTSTLNTISASGNVAVGGNLSVTNAATLQANATVNGNLSVAGTTQLTGVVTTSGNLNCSGNLSVSRQLTVSGITATQDITATNLNLSGNVLIGGNIANSTLSTRGNLQVAGWTTVTGDLSANNLFTSAQGNLTVGGLSTLANVQLSGNLTVNGFTQLQEVTAAGNANVSGNVNITRNLFVQSGSSATITGNLTAGNILTQGALTLSGGFYPYQPTVASSTLRDTSIYIGDTGINRTGTAQRNVAIGGGALRGSTSVPANNTGRDNIAIGWSAQENATGASAQIAIGSSAGRQALNAAQNVLIGNTCAAAGLQTNASVNNVVIGDSAMSTTTTDFANTCVVGAGAFVSASVSGTTTGTTSVGALAGASFLTANNSTLVGFQAGQSISSNNATMVGFQAGQNSLNHNFTAIGNSAGKSAGTNSTYIGSNTGGTFTNSTAVGYNAQTTADYEVVLGGDDGNASGNMPLLTLPNKMKLAGVRTFASGTLATLEFRFPENIVLTNSSITIVTLPTPDGTRANLNLGARFRLQKTFSGAVTVNAPAGQTISYNGASASSYTFQANEYYVTFLCIANTGTTWLALNAQGVDLKSAQTIGGGDKTFTANLIATNTSSTFNGSVSCTNGVAVTGNLATTGNVSLTGNLTVGLNATVSGNVLLNGNVVVPPSTSSTFQLGNVTLSRSSAAITATGSITAPYFQSYYINCTSDITLSLPDITSAKFAGSEIAFYKDPLAASYVVTLNASASDAVVAFGASVTTSSYSLSAGKTFVRFVANNNKWFETASSGGGVSPTDALTVAGLSVTSTGASISGTYPTTSYTLNVNGPMTATSFNASSDRRLKTNIQSLTSQWDVIQAIEPVSFAWKSDGKQEYGFIAQQVYNVLPEMRPNMVGKHPLSNPDEPLDMSGNPLFYGLDYSRMTPFLWQGMRELMNRVQELEETVRQLQNERSPL